MEVQLGDKLWMFHGPHTLVVGYLVDASPDNKMIAVSPCPYEDYKKMGLSQRATIPVTWFQTKYCTYENHIKAEDLTKLDETLKPAAGFRPGLQ